MNLILKNSSDTENLSYVGGQIIVPAGGQIQVLPYFWFVLYSDVNFIKDIHLGNVVVSNGVRDMTGEEADNYIKFIVSDFNYNNKDIDGALIVRQKAAKKGWTFLAVGIEVITSKLNGNLFAKDFNDSDIEWITCKNYIDDTLITDESRLLDSNKTIIDIEPNFNYEIIGGELRVLNEINEDCRMWIVGAPDIPTQFGGSREFASSINLKFLRQGEHFSIDGRVTKYMEYNPNIKQNKIRVIFKHKPGFVANLQLIVHLYK